MDEKELYAKKIKLAEAISYALRSSGLGIVDRHEIVANLMAQTQKEAKENGVALIPDLVNQIEDLLPDESDTSSSTNN